MITYYNISELKIFRVAAKIDLDSGQKFVIEFSFTDGKQFVCNAVVEPMMRDHRTGEWACIIAVAVSMSLKIDEGLRDRLKCYVKELSTELLYILTGEW